MASFDTGIVYNESGWSRCIVSFAFDGSTATMARFTEYRSNKCASTTSGKWTCPVERLLATTNHVGDVCILTPAWEDAKETVICNYIAGAAGR